MSEALPFLSGHLGPIAFPSEPAEWPGWLDGYTADRLAEHERLTAELTDGSERTALEVLHLWDDATRAAVDAGSLAHLMAEVHPDPVVRALGEERAAAESRLLTARSQDERLYRLIAGLDLSGLPPVALRLHERILLGFRLNGVDLPEEQHERVAVIEERLTVLGQQFDRNIRDDVRTVRLTAAQLDGLPEDYVAAHPLDADGLAAVTTDYPDAVPLRTYATDAAARRAITDASENRAWPANDAVLHEILDLRAELAALVGFATWADLDTATKMIGSAAGVEEFLDRLDAISRPAAERDRAALLEALREEDPDAETIEFADTMHATELVRRSRYAADSQEARRYFSADRVREGLLAVTSRLFGLEYTAVDVPVWHPEVHVYDVALEGEPIGRIYLDLHPREGKYKHAAAFGVRGGAAGRALAEGGLVCNFGRGLMEAAHVRTIFHEFGHLVHRLVGSRQDWFAFAGTAVQRDFVEAPSQLFEEWAWDPAVLRTFAIDEDGEPIPVELVERMRRANGFGRGQHVNRQLFYSAISHVLHRDRPEDLSAATDELQRRYDVLDPTPGHHRHCAFGHLNGYSSAYYTYMWSLAIARDLLSGFDSADLLDPAAARRYRDLVLAPGGSKDAKDLVADFLGRPYGFDAFAAWLAAE